MITVLIILKICTLLQVSALTSLLVDQYQLSSAITNKILMSQINQGNEVALTCTAESLENDSSWCSNAIFYRIIELVGLGKVHYVDNLNKLA